MGSNPRMTEQRRVILEELRMMDHHPTADELYQRVRERLPRISLGTVYRNLEKMAAAGIIRKLDHTGSQMRFDGDLHSHHHIRCVRCGRIDDLDEAPEHTGVDGESLARTGYSLIERKVEYKGLCPSCAAESEEEEGN